MSDDTTYCKKHGRDKRCLAGESAHPTNWYCPECDKDEELTRLRAQLQERDVKLATCTEAFDYVLNTPQTDPDWIRNVWGVCYRAKASLPATAKANAKIIAAAPHLLDQLAIGAFIDSNGHKLAMNKAFIEFSEAVREKKDLKP